MKKLFNPIIGETYENVTKEYRMITEQVSHHPPISAYNIEGNGFDCTSTVDND